MTNYNWDRKPVYTATIEEIRQAHKAHDIYMVVNQRGLLLDEIDRLNVIIGRYDDQLLKDLADETDN